MGKEQNVRAMEDEIRVLRSRVVELEEALATRTPSGDTSELPGQNDSTRFAAGHNADEYRALVESAGEAICTMDDRGVYLFMNAVAAERLGGTPQEFVGKTMWDLFPKEIADRQARMVRNVIHSGIGTMVESPTVVAGRQRWYRTSIEPVRDVDGNVASALVLARDITVRKQAEQALQRSETLYHTTIDALADAVHVVNRDLRITLFNAHFSDWCRELGLTTSAPGRTVFEQFPFLPDRVDQEYRKVFETGESLTSEDEVTVGGREILTETRKIPILEHGRVARVVTVVRDVTKLRQAERELRKSEERFRAQYKSMPIPTYTWKKTGNDFIFTDCNDAAKEITEGKIGRFIGVKLGDLHADEPRRVRDMHTCFETHKVVREESLYRFRTTGRKRYLASTYAFVPPDLVMVHTEDITERKRAERALQAAHLKLVNVREEERKYLAGELHDSVGQGLVVLQLAVQKAAGAVGAESKAALSLAAAAKTCMELVQEVRDISHGLYPPTLESLGLASSLAQLGRPCGSNVRFELDIADEVDGARFGPDREIALFRIGQEAVNNALRHSEAETIRCRLRIKGHWLRLTVADDGHGFDAGAPSGHGLGLQTMRDRAQAVGGRLIVSSRPGRTKIKATVPLQDPTEGELP